MSTDTNTKSDLERLIIDLDGLAKRKRKESRTSWFHLRSKLNIQADTLQFAAEMAKDYNLGKSL